VKVIVAGAGEKGYYAAKILVEQKNDITVIDTRDEALRRVEESLDVMVVHGSAAYPHALNEAGVQDADLLIAVTGSDETNMLTCMHAASYGVGTTVARVSNPDYFAQGGPISPNDVGIDVVIDPEELCAREFRRLLHTPGALDSVTFATGRARLVAFAPHPGDRGIEEGLRRIADRNGHDRELSVVSADHNGFRSGSSNDGPSVSELLIVGSHNAVGGALKTMGITEGRPRSVIIAGAGRIGATLASMVSGDGSQVTVIDRDAQAAAEAAEALPKCLVLCGDCLQSDVLEEAGISRTDAFVAVTENDETDIMACVTAKHMGAVRALSIVQNADYLDVLTSVPTLDAVVSRHLTAVSHILQHTHPPQIVSTAPLHLARGKAIEILAQPSSRITKGRLARHKLPRGTVMGVVVRQDNVFVPSDADSIRPDDTAIVLGLPTSMPRISDLFA
jgi:trk system potassium uptake protein